MRPRWWGRRSIPVGEFSSRSLVPHTQSSKSRNFQQPANAAGLSRHHSKMRSAASNLQIGSLSSSHQLALANNNPTRHDRRAATPSLTLIVAPSHADCRATPKRPGDLPDAPALGEPALDLFVSSHGQSPRHPPDSPGWQKWPGYGGGTGRLVVPRTADDGGPPLRGEEDRYTHSRAELRRHGGCADASHSGTIRVGLTREIGWS
jgi:hypothetical protein